MLTKLTSLIVLIAFSFVAQAQLITPPAATNKNSSVPRGYIIPHVEAIPGGVKIKVEVFHSVKKDPVTLQLQAAVNDGKGNIRVFNIKNLGKLVIDNPNNYYSNREFQISYSDLNKRIRTLTNSKTNLQIGPGVPLYVFALFNNSHQWGGPARGGLIYMPGNLGASLNAQSSMRTSELDLAFPIDQTMANLFSNKKTKEGLQVGGQIRSRVEGEGKYQIPLNDIDDVKSKLFELAHSPTKAKAVLGASWKISVEDRYMKKDSKGKLVLDKKGFPIPDPMVDTYYDNRQYEAAENDMAIRYRFTKGNNTGTWNFKPGIGNVTADGITYRVEYGVDATNDSPETIEKFAESTHPLNPFQKISQVIPKSSPVDFFEPSAKLTDNRYKFKLQHKNGLIIEVSLDDVTAESLRRSNGKTARFGQMEMDIEHLATKSTNTVSNPGIANSHGDIDTQMKATLKRLSGNAFYIGDVSMHDESDLDLKKSEVIKAHKSEFDAATKVIMALRNKLLGKDWLPGAQKYAMAAYELGLVREVDASQSVKSLITKVERINKREEKSPFIPESGRAKCEFLFRKH